MSGGVFGNTGRQAGLLAGRRSPRLPTVTEPVGTHRIGPGWGLETPGRPQWLVAHSVGVGLVSGPELTWVWDFAHLSLCLTPDGVAPLTLQVSTQVPPKSSQTLHPTLPFAQPSSLQPVGSLGPDGSWHREAWASLRLVGKGIPSWRKKPSGTQPSSSRVSGAGIRSPRKATASGCLQPWESQASLSSSLPVRPGGWEPVKGNEAVPNLCQGRATLPQGERAWTRASLLAPRWAEDGARGVGWDWRAEGQGGHGGAAASLPPATAAAFISGEH